MSKFGPFHRSALRAALAATSLITLSSAPVFAQEVSAENKAAARDLAIEGIKLAQSGKCDEAVPKLSRAEKLFHAPTILTWIGQCQIELGRYVEGTETLNRVVREKISEDAPEAFKESQKKAAELIETAKPKIGKLTIEVAPADIEGLEVTVDGRAISSALIGAPKPTDPGAHEIVISAPGYVSKTAQIELEEGGQESLAVELEVDPNAATPTSASGTSSDAAENGQGAGSSSNWIGWTTVGVGAALMAGGGVTGFLAMKKEGDLSCGTDGSCPLSEEETLDAARVNATVSTILFGVGGAVAVTGIVLLLTGGEEKSEAARGRYVSPTVGLGSLGLEGAF